MDTTLFGVRGGYVCINGVFFLDLKQSVKSPPSDQGYYGGTRLLFHMCMSDGPVRLYCSTALLVDPLGSIAGASIGPCTKFPY